MHRRYLYPSPALRGRVAPSEARSRVGAVGGAARGGRFMQSAIDHLQNAGKIAIDIDSPKTKNAKAQIPLSTAPLLPERGRVGVGVNLKLKNRHKRRAIIFVASMQHEAEK